MEVLRNDIENKVIYVRDDWGEVHGIDHDNFPYWYYGQIGYKTYLAFSNQKLKSKMEEHSMYDSITVSCRGFTGTLINLGSDMSDNVHICYTLSIRDTENGVLHILDNVKPYEIKLVSGRVTMGG